MTIDYRKSTASDNRSDKPPRRSSWKARLGAMAAGLGLLLAAGLAGAEGSRSLYPSGYGGAGSGRANLNLSPANTYLGIIPARTFVYVYAQAGEHILLGSRNRTAAGVGAIQVYDPPGGQTGTDLGFGTRGNETAPGSPSFTCDAGTTGLIGTRAAELAGPTAANGSDGGDGDRYAPCIHIAPATGVYGVLFGVGSAGGGANGSVGTPATSTNSVSAWDITVRSSDDASLSDIDGRVFTFAFAGVTGGNGDGRRVYSTVYYVSSDGYRYAQTQRGFDPNAYVLYSNAQGYLDQGEPLYKSVRGGNHYLSTGVLPPSSGVLPQGPQYPVFFSDVMSAPGVDSVLGYLGIPLSPPTPQISGVSFTYPSTGGSSTYVGMGGVFTFDALDTISFQIVISRDGVDFDPGHPQNRVLAGLTQAGANEIFWDGRDNSGVPIPAGSGFRFEVTGRNGEVHFPMLDVENNLSGGPTVTKLNAPGGPDSTVFFDDRGYQTRNGTAVGNLNGHLCANEAWPQPAPNHSLTGVDSGDPDWNGSGNYYRAWAGSTNNGADCAASTQFFGDAKGLDLWTFEASEQGPDTSGDLTILDIADVTALVSTPASVAPGGSVVTVVQFGNVGSQTALNTAYSAQLPAGLPGGVSCSGATCAYNPGTGLVTITGLPTALSPGQFTGDVVLNYTAGASGSIPVSATVTTSSAQPAPPAPQAPDTAAASTTIGGGGTLADVLASVSPPLVAAPGSTVTVPVTFRNLGPAEALAVTYSASLPPGLSGVSCAGATCSYDPLTGVVSITGGLPGSLASGAQTGFSLSYTAPSSGTVQVGAGVQTTTAETNTANNIASGHTNVSSDPVADVTASVSPPTSATPGSTVTVPVRFRNLGPLPAADVGYAVQLSPGLSDVTCAAPVSCTYDSGTGMLSFTGGLPTSLDSGQAVDFSVSYTAPESGPVVVTASISTSTAESTTANNSASAQTVIISLPPPPPPAGQIVPVPLLSPLGLGLLVAGMGLWPLLRRRRPGH